MTATLDDMSGKQKKEPSAAEQAAGSDLDVPEVHTRVEHGGCEGVAEHVPAP